MFKESGSWRPWNNPLLLRHQSKEHRKEHDLETIQDYDEALKEVFKEKTERPTQGLKLRRIFAKSM